MEENPYQSPETRGAKWQVSRRTRRFRHIAALVFCSIAMLFVSLFTANAALNLQRDSLIWTAALEGAVAMALMLGAFAVRSGRT